MSKYAWEITHDYVSGPIKLSDLKIVQGPANAPKELLEQLAAGEGEEFEMFDDDDNLYYKGLIVGEFDGFEPLDDFGMPNAGCTAIKLNGAFV